MSDPYKDLIEENLKLKNPGRNSHDLKPWEAKEPISDKVKDEPITGEHI